MTDDLQSRLRITPLGGCGEVGLNATLFDLDGDALLVDCGILLNLPDAPGVDSAMPDVDAIERDGRRLHAVLITHGHEDHIGAVSRLLDRYAVPVYATPFATRLLEHKLADAPKKRACLQEVDLGATVQIGPYAVEWVRVTHSIPDAAALLIETSAGRVLHSGDFKLDPDPLDGHTTDVERLKAIGDRGVDLMLSDSTNAERPGRTTCESKVGLEIERTVKESEGRVVVACFASHVHRIQNIVNAAAANGRKVALLGRALHNTWKIGTTSRYLDVDPAILVDESKVPKIDRSEILVLATGTQGESRAALARLAYDSDPHMFVEPGDRIIVSAMTIPGNMKSVRKIQNAFARRGVEVFRDKHRALHCSGHAHSEEQAELLRLVRPKNFVPVHGERTMLEAHAKIAIESGVPEANIRVVENGQGVELSGGRLTLGPQLVLEHRFIDGSSGALISWDRVGERRKVGFGGLVVCSVAYDDVSGDLIGTPAVSLAGLPEAPGLERDVVRELRAALTALRDRDADRGKIAKSSIRKTIRKKLSVRPMVTVHLHPVEREG